MKVFFISHSAVVATYREKLRLLAERKDVDLTLLLPHAWPEAGQRVLTQSQAANKEGFRIISLPIFFEGRVKRHFYPSFFKHLKDLKPDIIHVEEEPYSWVAWQSVKAAKKLNAKLVFFTWENLLEKFEFPHQHIHNFVLKNTDYAIAGGRKARELLLKTGFPNKKMSVIPQYGVNPTLFHKRNVSKLKKELKLGTFTVGYIGRLVPEKGIQHLIQAFALLKDPKTNLLIVGNGRLRESLEEETVRLNIASQVRFVKAMGQEQLTNYLNCMDVLALPSLTTPRWKEQFGRVIIEAQACEIPVIGSDSGAIPEVIDKAGLIFKEGDVKDLLKNLKKLLDSKTLRNKYAKLGRQRVLKLFTNQKIADQTYAIYQQLLNKKKLPR